MLSFIHHKCLSVLSELCLRVLWCVMVFIGLLLYASVAAMQGMILVQQTDALSSN